MPFIRSLIASNSHRSPPSPLPGAAVVLLIFMLVLPQTLALTSQNARRPLDVPSIERPAALSTAAAALAPSFHPPPLPTHREGTGVNPSAYHTTEPAPIGIADYGVDASQNPYAYSTASFAGQVQINSLSSYNSSLGTPDTLTFQLNVNLYLTGGSVAYEYWIQDVVDVNTSSHVVEFIDNVWNSSNVGAGLTSSSVAGNGTIGTSGSTDFYYDWAAASLPGNVVALSYPTNVTLEVVAADSGGVPAIAFEYDDAHGWVTYDNVRFPSAAGFLDYGFVVDGYGYELNNEFLDAELIMGGPGGGSQTTISSSDVQLFLYYWNGHNFQEVENAYNFGSDTAEGLNNGVSAGYYYLRNGSLFARVTASPGTLGVLYDVTTVASVNISTPVSSGELYINGTDYGPFYGSESNVTVGPGTFTFSIYVQGTPVASKTVTVTRGEYLPLPIGFGAIFTITFVASGLPSGTSWSVTIGSTTLNSATTSIVFTEPNGSFGYTVGSVAGYEVTPQSGNVGVSGSSVQKDLTWTERQFTVTFSESGLPLGTGWSATLNGSTETTTSSDLQFTEVLGTYSYVVAGVPGYQTTPWRGSVGVSSFNQTVSLIWTQTVYSVWFNETGLPAGTPWQLNLHEAPTVFLNGSYTVASAEFHLPNGTYAYSIGAPATYTATPAEGSVPVTASSSVVTVSFAIRNGVVTGTISPSSASVWIGGVVAHPTGSGAYNASEPPGRTSIEVTATGYQPFFANVTVAPGQATWENVTLMPSPSSSSSGNVDGLPVYAVAALAGVVVIVVAIAAFLLGRRGRAPPKGARPPPGAT